MKAFIRTDAISQNVELVVVPIPEFQANEVLIKVEAFGVGIHDRYFIPNNAQFPYIIGSEGAGVIEKVGEEVESFAVGDQVIFTTSLQAQGGSWAEYAVAKQDVLIDLPGNMTSKQGAAIPIAGKTALECMRELGLNKDDSLFIAGASGAIGTFIIQMAAAKGIHVSASASAKNHDYMKSLGAEKTVDYNDSNWINEVKEWSKGGVTAALAIQPGTGIDSIEVVKDDGLLITVSGYNTSISPQRGIEVRQMGHQQDTQQKMGELVNAVSQGEIQVVIEKEYLLNQALDALKKTETRRARGKLVVKVNERKRKKQLY
jgi:NADPH:quinone reductase-like Zn-dependent oxidoreductase